LASTLQPVHSRKKALRKALADGSNSPSRSDRPPLVPECPATSLIDSVLFTPILRAVVENENEIRYQQEGVYAIGPGLVKGIVKLCCNSSLMR
jgi:hypothetical protein